MTPENFCYWLQGYFEILNDVKTLNTEQCKIIQDHLKLVFNKVTPDYISTIQTIPSVCDWNTQCEPYVITTTDHQQAISTPQKEKIRYC